MAYVCELSAGRTLYLDNLEGRTIVTIASKSSGQQQQASSIFQTGDWVATPEVYLTSDGAVVKLQAVQGSHYIRVHGGSIGVSEAFSLDALQQMQMQQISGLKPSIPKAAQASEPMQPIPSMPPMQPMTMGEMQMNSNSMQMRMGNMEMQMGENASSQPIRRFCTQCGSAIQASDRFCTSCGHQLRP